MTNRSICLLSMLHICLNHLMQHDLILIDHSKNLLRGDHGDVTAVRRGSHGEYFLPAVL